MSAIPVRHAACPVPPEHSQRTPACPVSGEPERGCEPGRRPAGLPPYPYRLCRQEGNPLRRMAGRGASGHRRGRDGIRFLAGVLAALIATAVLTPAASAAAPAFRLRDGVSQPIYSYAGAIRETAWVETGQDLDRDGKTDRVAADIIPPAEPAARGRRVPVIMDVSPYYLCCGRGNEQQTKTYAPDGT